MEYFELMAPDGTPIGQVKERTAIHRDGDLHGGAHVWVVGPQNPDGTFPVLLQRRPADRDSFPNCLDTSCARHVLQGETFLSTAVCEVREELNLAISEADLIFLCKKQSGGSYRFHGKPFHNHEVHFVYLLNPNFPLDNLPSQEEASDRLIWMNSADLQRDLLSGSDAYCVEYWELEELLRYLRRVH